MSRRIIDERDALRRTVARQDADIRRLNKELRKLRDLVTHNNSELGK